MKAWAAMAGACWVGSMIGAASILKAMATGGQPDANAVTNAVGGIVMGMVFLAAAANEARKS